MTPQRLRAYVEIVMRLILPPSVGAFLSIYLPLSGQFEYWQLPLLAGLFGVPLVSGGGEAPPPPDTPPDASLPPGGERVG